MEELLVGSVEGGGGATSESRYLEAIDFLGCVLPSGGGSPEYEAGPMDFCASL